MMENKGAVLDALGRLRRPGPRVQRILGAIGVVTFAVIVVWGVKGYRDADLEVQLWYLVLAAVVGTPLALALNALEFRTIASSVGADMTGREVVVATLFASAANSLPLPGSVLVRGWSMSQKGATLGEVVRAQAVAGMTFVAVAVFITGLIITSASRGLGLVVAVAGGVAVLLTFRLRARWPIARLLMVETLMIGSELGRYALVLFALGVDVTPARVAGLVLANVLAVATGVFPGGLGVREAFAGLLARLSDMGAAVAVTVSAADRVATSLVLAALVAVAFMLRLHRVEPDGPDMASP